MFNYVKFPEKSIDSFSFYIICHYYSAATLREEFLNHKKQLFFFFLFQQFDEIRNNTKGNFQHKFKMNFLFHSDKFVPLSIINYRLTNEQEVKSTCCVCVCDI